MHSSRWYFVIWLIAGLVAMTFAMQMHTAAFVDGNYIPVGNDSFYHARRIIDAAISERGFYQFDNMIHIPEGSWLTWPWAYDFLMSRALILALWINPTMEPMSFLAHVPVAWVFVNAGLMTLIARQIQLSTTLTAIALLGYALLPLTQTLHGLGVIDHHFIEQTFVLASVLTGLRFFSGEYRISDAVLFGLVLGVAPAFHNGLFILQIPMLACVFMLWMRQSELDERAIQWLAGSLVVTTLLVSMPSTPFRLLQFEFWTLSWFHLYIAICSALSLVFLGMRSFSKANIGLFFLGATLLLVPLLTKILAGSAFLAGDLILLADISEVQSPLARIVEPGGVSRVTTYNSWLIFLTPFLLLLFAIRAWRENAPSKIYFSEFAIFGILLMLVQSRLHPFGSWAILLGSLSLLDEWRKKRGISILATSAASLLILAAAYQPPLSNRLFHSYPPGLSMHYAATRTLFPSLATSCAKNPGSVLSHNDDGHYIRYHTDCSVLTNNFLLTPVHEKKILEASRLLAMTPEQFLQEAPGIDYVFVRMYEIFEFGPDGVQPTSLSKVRSHNPPLFVALTFDDDIPSNYRLIDEVRVDDGRDFAYARVFQVIRTD
jgi:hypothetical protein